MFTIDDLKHTRVYQDAIRDGQADLILRQVTRKFGILSKDQRSLITQLSPTKFEELGEVIFDISSLTELEQWLQKNK